jgi:hypothetical protein
VWPVLPGQTPDQQGEQLLLERFYLPLAVRVALLAVLL